MLRKDINKQNVTDALKAYLYKVLLPRYPQPAGQEQPGQLPAFFAYNLSIGIREGAFGCFDPDGDSGNENSIYHELKRPYSLYNWELFFHTPMLLAAHQPARLPPYFARFDKEGKLRDPGKVHVTDVVLLTHSELLASEVFIRQGAEEIAFANGGNIGTATTFAIRDEEIKVTHWGLVIKNTSKAVDKALMAVRFVIK